MFFSAITILLAAAVTSGVIVVPVGGMVGAPTAPPHRPKRNGAVFHPVMQDNFADPSIITVDGVIYTFATTTAGVNVPVATKQNGHNMQMVMSDPGHALDAMPTLPKWSSGGIWAPDVLQLVSPDDTLQLQRR